VSGRFETVVRRAVNPLSTRVTMWWQTTATTRALHQRPSRRDTSRLSPPVPVPQLRRQVRGVAVAYRVSPMPGHSGRVVVPDVLGLTWTEARRILDRVHLIAVHADGAEVVGTERVGGVVVRQDLPAGTVVPTGAWVTLWLAPGPGSAGVREPRRPRPGPRTVAEAVPEPTSGNET
jgi:PASTA domain